MNARSFSSPQAEQIFQALKLAWSKVGEVRPDTAIRAFNTGLFRATYIDQLDVAEVSLTAEDVLKISQPERTVDVPEDIQSVGQLAECLARYLITDDQLAAFRERVLASFKDSGRVPFEVSPKPGDVVHALRDQTWRPAQVLAVLGDNVVRVRYLGLGPSVEEDLTPDRYRFDTAGLPGDRVQPLDTVLPAMASAVSPDGSNETGRFLSRLAIHVAMAIGSILAFILLLGGYGGLAALFRWPPLSDRNLEAPQWFLYDVGPAVCGFLAALGLLHVGRGAAYRLAHMPGWKGRVWRWPGVFVGTLLGATVGAVLGVAGGAILCGGVVLYCGLCVVLLGIPLALGKVIGEKYYDLAATSFGSGFGMGVLGASALLLGLGIPASLFGMFADLWRFVREWLQEYATGRAFVRLVYGAIAGAVVGALGGWFLYHHAWNHAWTDAGAERVIVPMIVLGAILSGLAQSPRDGPEQVYLAGFGAAVGAGVYLLIHAWFVGGSFGSYLAEIIFGILVGGMIAWGCWLVFNLLAGWFIAPGPTFGEVFPPFPAREINDIRLEIARVDQDLHRARAAAFPGTEPPRSLGQKLSDWLGLPPDTADTNEARVAATEIELAKVERETTLLFGIAPNAPDLALRTRALHERWMRLKREDLALTGRRLSPILRPWLLLPAALLLLYLAWTDLPFRRLRLLTTGVAPEKLYGTGADASRIRRITLSENGEWTLFCAGDGKVHLFENAQAQKRACPDGFPHAYNFGFCPAPGRMWSQNGSAHSVWDFDARKPLYSFDAIAIAWTKDNQIICLQRDKWEWRDAHDGKFLRTAPGPFDPLPLLACTTDGKIALTVHKDSRLRQWDLTGAREMREFHFPGGTPVRLTLCPRGKRALLVGDNGGAWLLDVTSGEFRALCPSRYVHCAAMSNDGERVLVGSGTGVYAPIDPMLTPYWMPPRGGNCGA